MKLSPAPTQPQRPDSAACSSAHGAGVQFATDPLHGMRVKERDCLPAKTMQNGTRRVGGIQFAWCGHTNHGLPWPGWACRCHAWQHVTPRNGGNFSGLAIASLGWARQCSTGRGNSATRGDIAGQFRGEACRWRGTVWHVSAAQQRELGAASKRNFTRPAGVIRGKARQATARLYVTGDGNPGHFPKHQEAPASRGATVNGMTGNV